jgi:hypothetical protein
MLILTTSAVDKFLKLTVSLPPKFLAIIFPVKPWLPLEGLTTTRVGLLLTTQFVLQVTVNAVLLTLLLNY